MQPTVTVETRTQLSHYCCCLHGPSACHAYRRDETVTANTHPSPVADDKDGSLRRQLHEQPSGVVASFLHSDEYRKKGSARHAHRSTTSGVIIYDLDHPDKE